MAGNIPLFVPHSGCPQRCSFCNQHTISGSGEMPTPTEAVALCAKALATLPQNCQPVEIAFFGGSFTAIPRQTMTGLLTAVQPFLADSRISGIRISTRPDAIDAQVLALLKDYGVTAIELGAQSMDDQVLAKNQRGHTAQQVDEAATRIKKAGFSLGLQMMTGLYGATPASDEETARRLVLLCPDTVRIYPTVVLAGTPLAALAEAGQYSPPGVEQSLPLLVRLVDLFKEKSIPIIRLGLHASPQVEASLIGGCYHPALGELVQGERYLQQLLTQAERLGGTSFRLRIAPRRLSQVLGQKKRNLAMLQQFGYNMSYESDTELGDIPFVLEKESRSVEATGNRTAGL